MKLPELLAFRDIVGHFRRDALKALSHLLAIFNVSQPWSSVK
jgi:hypothetical protein